MKENDTIEYFEQAYTIEQLSDTARVQTIKSIDTSIEIPFKTNEKDQFLAESINHKPFVPDWAIIIFVITSGLLAWLKTTSATYLLSLIQSGFNKHTANRLYREKSNSIVHPSYRLNTLFFLSISAFLYHFKQFFPNFFKLEDLHLYGAILSICIIFISIKVIFYRFLGFIFNTTSETDEFLFYSMSGYHILGIFLLPVSVIMFFTEGYFDLLFAFLGILIALAHSVISTLRGFVIIAQKDFSIYYLILYLCTLEILPLLLLWRILR